MSYKTVNIQIEASWIWLHVYFTVILIIFVFLHTLLLIPLHFLFPLLILLIKCELGLIVEWILHGLHGFLEKIASNLLIIPCKLILKLLKLGKLKVLKWVKTSYYANPIYIYSNNNLVFTSHQLTLSFVILFPFSMEPFKTF